MNIVEETYYEHDTHGRVHVILVTDETVSFDVDEQFISDRVPKTVREPIEVFEEKAEPASVSVDASPGTLVGK